MKLTDITKAWALAAAVVSMTLTGCSDDREAISGQGLLALQTTVKSDVKVMSRAQTQDELAEKAIVWISNPKGVVRKYNGLANVPAAGIPLLSDHYVAEAWTGDSLSASFDHKWFKGREEFDIVKDQTTQVNIKCTVANTVAAVRYGESVDNMLKDFKLTVGHKRGQLVFEGRDERNGYFMMPSTDKNLQWNLEGTLANGTVYTRSGVIENAKPATLYVINIDYNPGTEDPDNTGGAYFTIKIDERTIDVEEEVEITLAPQFEGYDFDLSEELFSESGKVGRRSVLVNAVGSLTSLVVESSLLQEILEAEDVDLFNMSDAVGERLRNAGINYVVSYDNEQDFTQLKINFEEVLLNSLTEGAYDIKLTATDSYGKTTSGTFKLNISDAPIVVEDVVLTDVWATRAALSARILKSDASNFGISYRKKGDTTWTAADATVSGTSVNANLSGLQPGTTYEFTSTATDYISSVVKEFTTEAATQLPNAGFENWQTSSTPYLVYGSGEDMFWDSGNHGSATMSKNVTLPDTEIKHSGNYSIKLASQFVGVMGIGKFAAGNVFVGKYLGTEGTNGVLGWGRPWTSRPSALKGYLHFTPKTITSTELSDIKTGDPDTGIIYVAIVDNTMTGDPYNGEDYPCIVKTKSKQFFNPDGANVIAYGELVLTEATSGTTMVEFNIPINYKRTDIKACNIILVASASRYGDYFTGGDGTTLYLDDLELIY